MLVVNLSPGEHFEVHAGGGVVHTHQTVTESHHEVQAEDNDVNEDNDDGHGACGQDRLRAEGTDHAETSLTGDDGRYDLGHPGEAEETGQVVIHDELEHRAVPAVGSYSVTSERQASIGQQKYKLCVAKVHRWTKGYNNTSLGLHTTESSVSIRWRMIR